MIRSEPQTFFTGYILVPLVEAQAFEYWTVKYIIIDMP